MKKKLIFIPIIILVIIVLASIYGNSKNYLSLKGYPNTKIMITHNGDVVSSFPDKDDSLYYNVEVSCDNANARWDYENWRVLISNLKSKSKCNISFTSSSKTTLYNKIYTDYNEGNNTKHIYLEEHDYNADDDPDYYEYRYEGTDTEVENYVWFNNELWRIIGAFPGGTPSTVTEDGTFVQGDAAPSTENTVKIIRNDVIGSFAWDKDDTNNWLNSELNTNILNNLYLNSLSGTCNFYSTSVSKTCSFESNGLGNVGDYLTNVTWNLGGYSSAPNPQDMYNYERGNTVYSGRPYLTTAKVGLMYPSDYGYATSSDSCQTGTNLSSYGSCGSNGWILKNGNEWTQSPYSSNNFYVWYVSSLAYVNYGGTYSGYGVRPVVYLKSNVYVTGGSGSINNPYQIRVGG